jgi:hypothetical protein
MQYKIIKILTFYVLFPIRCITCNYKLAGLQRKLINVNKVQKNAIDYLREYYNCLLQNSFGSINFCLQTYDYLLEMEYETARRHLKV